MRSTLLLALCAGMLAICLAALPKNIRWCVKSEAELRKCKDLSRTCSCDTITLSCIHRANTDECFKAISVKKQDADAITLDTGDLYRGSFHPYDLKPIVAENYGTKEDPDTCYYAVALVKKSSTFMIKDLKGKRSCHTAAGRMAGWYAPIGYLRSTGQITWKGPEETNIEKAVLELFQSGCAPGAKEERLCRQCAGQGKDKKCKMSDDEPYYGYAGACKCLKDDRGDVAFLKHIIPAECNNEDEYELLCPDGRRKPLSQYSECFLGRVPAHAVVSLNDAEKIKTIQEFLQQAQHKQGCNLFDSSHGADLMFKSSAKELVNLPAKMDVPLYLGKALYEASKALHREIEPPPEDKISWCTQNTEEKRKCDEWAIASEGAIECIEASFAEESITKILKGECDAATLDGGYLYTAGACGLVPAMGEIYDADECKKVGSKTPGSYYAVAIIHASDKDTKWPNLRGKKTCHTAVGRTAGWNIPAGLLTKEAGTCDMSTYFKESCAPGADPSSNLCSLCVGVPTKSVDSTKCLPSNKETYYGYEGALRCLVESPADVAFVKHTTIQEVFNAKAAWLKGKTLDDFRLLCPDGSVKRVTEYKDCHLAEVPAHAVATQPSRRDVVVKILKAEQSKYGKGKSEDFDMFKSEGRKDQLFKDSTECLREITLNMDGFLGKDYTDSVALLSSCTQSELLAACTFHTCKL